MDFTRMCRLCLRKEEEMYPIFMGENDNEISRKIRQCLSVEVQWNDPMPKYVCKRCKKDLDMFSEFHDIALRADEANKSYLEMKSRIDEMEKRREMQSVAVGTEDLDTYQGPSHNMSSNTVVNSSGTVPKEPPQQAPAREMVDPTNSKTPDAATAEKENDNGDDIVVLAEHLSSRKRRRTGHASANQNISHQEEEENAQKNQQPSTSSSEHHEHHLIDGHVCRRILKTLQSIEDLKTFLPPSATLKHHEQLSGSAKTDTPLSDVEKSVGMSATVDSEHDGHQLELAKVNTPSDQPRDVETTSQTKPTQNGHEQETVACESPKEGL